MESLPQCRKPEESSGEESEEEVSPEDIKLILAVAGTAGAMYGLVTRPLMALLKAEMNAIRAEMKADAVALKSDLKAEINTVKVEMSAMEKRLNERIDVWVLKR